MTFVTVGNSLDPFPRLLDEVARLASAGALPEPVIVQHGNSPFACEHCQANRFIDRERFQELLAEATLVITHGGMTVMHAIRHGKIPVVMPRRAIHRECADEHQLEFSHPRAAAGEIVLAETSEQLADSVRRALALQAQGNRTPSALEPPLVGEIRDLLQKIERQRARK